MFAPLTLSPLTGDSGQGRRMFTTAPYGEWWSPITTRLLVADSVRLGGVALDGECVYWLEGRPSEGGRNVLVCRDGEGVIRDVTLQRPYPCP